MSEKYSFMNIFYYELNNLNFTNIFKLILANYDIIFKPNYQPIREETLFNKISEKIRIVLCKSRI